MELIFNPATGAVILVDERAGEREEFTNAAEAIDFLGRLRFHAYESLRFLNEENAAARWEMIDAIDGAVAVLRNIG